MALDESNLNFDTLALHAGQVPDPHTTSRAVPIYQTTSYVFKDTEHAASLFGLKEFGNIYTRIQNPTQDVFEKRVAALEGGVAALATASGQAATQLAIFNIAHAGDDVIAGSGLYGGSYNLLHYTMPKMGITVKFADISDPENLRRAITDKTKVIFGETAGNPRLDTFPIREAADIAHENGLPLIMDNTTPSPWLVNPLQHGADIVMHSATKFIGGHGTTIGGVIVDGGTFDWGNGKFPNFTEPDPSYHGLKYWETFGDFPGMGNIAYIIKARVQMMRDLGAAISPFNAFMLLQGLETLHVRMERHCQNAMKVAQFLEAHPNVEWVLYPGLESHPTHDRAKQYYQHDSFGALVGFGIKSGYEGALKFIDRLDLFSLLANIGDAKSLVIHPASTTHQQLAPNEQLTAGVTPDFIRLSVGLEDIDDILGDLDQALRD